MNPPAHLPESEAAIWSEIVRSWGADADRVVGPELEAYCGQVARLREAQRRIAVEGLVTADPKGFPIPHPAIAIEKSAQAEIRAWGDRFRPDAGFGL